jgi:predicted membrane channel-forming protein YqfA (hemolysin III family)
MADKPWFASTGPLWTVAIGAALTGVMLLAILAPRIFGLEETSWWVTVAVGVLIGAGVVIYGYAKRDSGEADVTSPDH